MNSARFGDGGSRPRPAAATVRDGNVQRDRYEMPGLAGHPKPSYRAARTGAADSLLRQLRRADRQAPWTWVIAWLYLTQAVLAVTVYVLCGWSWVVYVAVESGAAHLLIWFTHLPIRDRSLARLRFVQDSGGVTLPIDLAILALLGRMQRAHPAGAGFIPLMMACYAIKVSVDVWLLARGRRS